MQPRLFRSLLFAPASSPRKIENAFMSDADGIIIDLEDSVAVAEKPAARAALVQAFASPLRLPAFVRVNAVSTSFFHEDMKAISQLALTGVMVPKVESAADLAVVDEVLREVEARNGVAPHAIEILPILETARGLSAAAEVAGASPRIRRLTFGAIDLALDMDISIDEPFGVIDHARFMVALASRAARLAPPFDTAFVDFSDLDRLRADARRARAFGFHGKCCIHPTQVEVVNAVFTPTAVETARARRIVEAFDQAEGMGVAAVNVDGQMVDYPVVSRARRLLTLAQSRGQ
jgi:citrate lyase subunit beta / citryl-CoA lyase